MLWSGEAKEKEKKRLPFFYVADFPARMHIYVIVYIRLTRDFGLFMLL